MSSKTYGINSKKIIKTIHHPCLYCGLETTTYVLEGDTEDRVQNMIDYNTYLIRFHVYDQHKDLIFIKSDHPYINEKGEIEDNVQF